MAVTHEGPTEISGALRMSLKYSRYGAPFRGRTHRRVMWLRARDARRLAARGTACVALVAAVWLLTAAPGLAAPRNCYSPRVQGADTIVAWNMTCTSARRVAKAWVAASLPLRRLQPHGARLSLPHPQRQRRRQGHDLPPGTQAASVLPQRAAMSDWVTHGGGLDPI